MPRTRWPAWPQTDRASVAYGAGLRVGIDLYGADVTSIEEGDTYVVRLNATERLTKQETHPHEWWHWFCKGLLDGIDSAQ